MKYIFFVIFNLTVAVSDNSREYRESYTRSELFDLKWPNRYMHLVDGDFIMEVRSTCIQFWKTSPERFLCIHSTNHSRTRWLGSGATCYEMTGFWGSFSEIYQLVGYQTDICTSHYFWLRVVVASFWNFMISVRWWDGKMKLRNEVVGKKQILTKYFSLLQSNRIQWWLCPWRHFAFFSN